jgi:SAM-dependent methyltransferase
VKRPTFIARQSAKPSGALGRIIGRVMARETAELNEEAVRLLSVRPSDCVLEVGFGHGRTVERIAADVPQGHVTGIDVSQAMTRLATRRNRRAIGDGRVDLWTGDCAQLPFNSGQFDRACPFTPCISGPIPRSVYAKSVVYRDRALILSLDSPGKPAAIRPASRPRCTRSTTRTRSNAY